MGTTGTIIFINRYFYPDVSATSQLLTDLAVELAAENRRVRVITGRRLYNNNGATVLPKHAAYKGVQIRRIRTTNFGRFGIAGRAVDFVAFYIMATFTLLFVARADDILVAKTDPPLMSILVRLVGSLKRAKTVNWLQDIFPEIAEQLGMTPRGYGVGNLLRGLRNWSLRYADANVVLGEKMRQKLRSLGIPDEKIRVIPNWSDGDLIHPLPHKNNPLREKWGLTDKFVVAYSGNMGRAHEFDTVIEAAKQLKSHPNIVFLWIGGGVKRQRLETIAKQQGITSFIFKDYQPKEKLPQSLAVGDIHLVVLSSNLEGLIVPSKFYGVAAAARPVLFIGDEDGEIARIIKNTDCGYSLTHNDSQQLAQLLLQLSKDPSPLRRKGKNARKLFEARYTLPHACKEWSRLFTQIKATGRVRFLPRANLNTIKK